MPLSSSVFTVWPEASMPGPITYPLSLLGVDQASSGRPLGPPNTLIQCGKVMNKGGVYLSERIMYYYNVVNVLNVKTTT